MITEHRWNCQNCDLKFFLRVDDSIWHDRQKLQQFERAISNHIFIERHEVTHKEKAPFKIKYS